MIRRAAAAFAVSLAAAASAWALPPGPAPSPRVAEGLLAHRSSYDLVLRSASWGSGVATFNGKLVSEFDDACAGYTYNQRLVTNFTDDEGKAFVGDLRMSSFEDAAGERYRFNLTNIVNGEKVEASTGRAERSPGGGKVTFAGANPRDFDLPQGILFPTEYMARALAAARSGRNAFRAQMFEGDSEGKIFDVVTIIGPARAATEAELAVRGGDVLRGLRGWPLSVSYYPSSDRGELPEYQVSYTLFENGVSTDLILDYGDFQVTGRLGSIDRLSGGGC